MNNQISRATFDHTSRLAKMMEVKQTNVYDGFVIQSTIIQKFIFPFPGHFHMHFAVKESNETCIRVRKTKRVYAYIKRYENFTYSHY